MIKLIEIFNYNDLQEDDIILMIDNRGYEDLAKVTCVDNEIMYTYSLQDKLLNNNFNLDNFVNKESFNELDRFYKKIYLLQTE